MKLPSGANREHIRVLVAESSQIESQLLASALRRHPGFQVTACQAELSKCLATLQVSPADVVLLGVNSTVNYDGNLGLVRGLSAAHPQLGLILMLSTYDRELVVNAIHCGARALFCCDRQPLRALCKCVYSVYKGQIWTNADQMNYIIDALRQAPALHLFSARGAPLLTSREEQVVALVAEGMSNREIARRLKVTENTVKKSMLRIFDKLGISNRVELVLYALTARGGPGPAGAFASRKTALNSSD